MSAAATTAGALLGELARRLAGPEVRREARLILAGVLGCEPGALLAYPERPVAAPEAAEAMARASRRAAGEPLSRILGRREFWSLTFALSPATLDPRPDSETLVEAALALCRRPRRVLDFGTGTGCLLLAVLSEWREATGVGIDVAPAAAATARRNAVALGLGQRAAFCVSDWGAAIDGYFDVILANPPYIRRADLAALPPEVAFDPTLALDGGSDGLDAYRRLASDARRLLAPGGLAFFEVGAGQAAAVAEIMAGGGLAREMVRHDLAGRERVLVVRHGVPAEK